jgi:DNA-binding XRE family transcriptional regulator
MKIYQLYGIDTAMHLLRPGAKWEISNTSITQWEDDRPCPTWQELMDTMEKIKAFEDSIDTIFTDEQIEKITGKRQMIDETINGV